MSRMDRILRPFGLSSLVRTRTYRVIRDPAWAFSRLAIRSRARLRALYNSQKGARGYIVGTGPSLQRVDFTRLRGQPSIGLNRLFLGFQTFDFVPDFLVCVNPIMIQQSAQELAGLPCQVVASWVARRDLRRARNTVFLRTFDDTRFSSRLMDGASAGGTVTYVALQLAFWLGWEKVTLVGIDHRYALGEAEQDLEPHSPSRRDGPDPNHFHHDYMPAGKVWQLPDLAQSEVAYGEARTFFERHGRQVCDATIDGGLTVFARCADGYALAEPRAEDLATLTQGECL